MQILSIPLHRSDETLYSFAARLRRSNAARNDREACRSMFGPAPHMRVSEFPVNLTHFCQATKQLLGPPEKILSQMTLIPLFERIGAWPLRRGNKPRPAAIAGYGLSTLSNGNIHTWRACKECLRQDISLNPYGYWRRAHQLPGLLLCPTHHTPLVVCTAPATQFHNQFVLPDEVSLENTADRIDTGTNANTLQILERFSVAALHDDGEYLDKTTTVQVIVQALENHDLLSPRGKICREVFVPKFLRCFGFLRHHREFADSVSCSGVEILCRSLDAPRVWRSCLHQLLLLSWLFGSWEAFKAHCQWQQVMNGDNCMLNLHAEGNLTKKPDMRCALDFHRKKCIDFIIANAIPSRTKFAHDEGRSFRWLLNNDIEWFNQQCPPYSKYEPQLRLL
jgi:TniQ